MLCYNCYGGSGSNDYEYFDCDFYDDIQHYFHYNVSFAVPPTVSMGQPRMTAISGSRVELRCHVTGSPAPKIQWLKQGGSLPAQHSIDGDQFL